MDPKITFLKTVAKVHQNGEMDKQQPVLRGRMVERQCGINATMGRCQVSKGMNVKLITTYTSENKTSPAVGDTAM